MEEKYREIVSELLYYISDDIDTLLYEDYDDIIEAISRLARKVNILSDRIYENGEIVYERPDGKADYKFSLD